MIKTEKKQFEIIESILDKDSLFFLANTIILTKAGCRDSAYIAIIPKSQGRNFYLGVFSE